MTESRIQWVDSNLQLQKLCEQLEECSTLAADTEFIRTDTFFPILALIQISDGDGVWLIDVLAISEFEPLRRLCADHRRTIIFHACLEDLEVLEHSLSIIPQNLFDTQLAAALANVGYSMGYARLVKTLFDIELGKNETRSDWMARPLSDEQIRYAAEDVLHLHALREKLQQQLEASHRMPWLAEETTALRDMLASRASTADYYQRIKGAWRLGFEELGILMHLSEWRESVARSLNRPRGRVIKDQVLLEIASRRPARLQDLHQIEDLPPGARKRWGEEIIRLVSQPAGHELMPALPTPLSRGENKVLQALRQQLYDTAEANAIPQEFLCNRKELESIVRSATDSGTQWPERFMQGWREPLTRRLRANFHPYEPKVEPV